MSIAMLLVIRVFGQPGSMANDTTDHCETGHEHFKNYRFGMALNSLEHCFRNDSANIDCLKKIALCNYKLGRLKQAKSNYLEILGRDSTAVPARNQLAVIYSKELHYGKSIEQYAKLIGMDSTNGYYHKQVGLLCMKMGEVERAIEFMESAHHFSSGDITVIAD